MNKTISKLLMSPSRDEGILEIEHLKETLQVEMWKLYVLRMEH